MASAHITRRQWLNAKGGKVVRYHVRGRLGGRGWPLVHFGSFKTMREAELRLRMVEDELASGKDPRASLGETADKSATLASFAQKWFASRHDYSPATAKRVNVDVKRIVDSPMGRKPISTVTRDDVEKNLRDNLIGAGLAAGTIRNFMVTLRQVFDYAEVEPNPARSRSIKIPKTKNEPVTVPTREEAERIKAAARGRYALAVRMLEATGARAGELCMCEWRDFDLDTSRWRIRGTKTHGSVRTVPLPDDVVESLRSLKRDSDRVFGSMAPEKLWRGVNQACKDAGTLLYNPKSFRHLFGSRLVAAGVSIPQVALLMGHENQSTTMKYYLHVLPEHAGGDALVMYNESETGEVPAK